jgi:hypothetical protein
MIKIRLENVEGHLIKLPVLPSTIEELALIRFWLLRLSQAHFEYMYAQYGILNPEFLSVLNPRTGPRKILFHANDVVVDDYETAIRADFAQFIRARQIYLQASFLDEPHRNNLFKFIMGAANAIEKFHIRSCGPNQGEFCELFVKVIFDHRSFLTVYFKF